MENVMLNGFAELSDLEMCAVDGGIDAESSFFHDAGEVIGYSFHFWEETISDSIDFWKDAGQKWWDFWYY